MSHHEPACLFQTALVNDTITLGYHTQIVVFRQNYCFKRKTKENKRKLLCYGTDSRKFSEEQIYVLYADGIGYPY